ncbi:MAG: deoxyribose-phosphate aldolase [Candidatus Enteromonas sp.]|nr:deoxyribose-phosphate aldolase [Candidatus Enteromonas sp.]MDY6094376.1 deoxyribose-phosphate aldolase [Candidatus Enteromonas sp.]
MEFNKLFDHTLLKAEATTEEIKKLCMEAKQFDFASVCVNPAFVAYAFSELADTDVKVCTVIGFPLGANVSSVKAAEASIAVDEGAKEVDMVVNLGKVKEGDFEYVEKDIAAVKAACGDALLKVILETAALTDEEIVACCKASVAAGADFVKTSTGFHKAGGASVHAVEIMRKTVGENVGVKASGGIHTLEEAEAMVKAGANRIGCSASVAIMTEWEAAKK